MHVDCSEVGKRHTSHSAACSAFRGSGFARFEKNIFTSGIFLRLRERFQSKTMWCYLKKVAAKARQV